MRTIVKNGNIIIYIENIKIDFDPYNKEDIENYLKSTIIKLKRKEIKDISGFYKAKVYHNKNYGLITELVHESDLDFFPDLIDLKIIVNYNSLMYIKIKDYFLLNNKEKIYYYKDNYYVSIDEITKEEQIKLSEFYSLIYGEELNKIKKEFILV